MKRNWNPLHSLRKRKNTNEAYCEVSGKEWRATAAGMWPHSLRLSAPLAGSSAQEGGLLLHRPSVLCTGQEQSDSCNCAGALTSRLGCMLCVRACACVCMHTCVQVCMCVCLGLHVCAFVFRFAHVQCTCVFRYAYACMFRCHICVWFWVCMCAFVCVFAFRYACVQVYVFLGVQVHLCVFRCVCVWVYMCV